MFCTRFVDLVSARDKRLLDWLDVACVVEALGDRILERELRETEGYSGGSASDKMSRRAFEPPVDELCTV